MAGLTIVTINILGDLKSWGRRRSLLAEQLRALQPDLVALQEVIPPAASAEWLAKQIGLGYLHQTSKTGPLAGEEAIALLSRLPFEVAADLDLQSQNRVAQAVRVQAGRRSLTIANGHFYWQPGDSSARLKQVEVLLGWLQDLAAGGPTVMCGDFNGMPTTRAIRRIKQVYRSAYEQAHGKEPRRTFPTPLRRSRWSTLASISGLLGSVRLNEISFKLSGVLDYIFISPDIPLEDCRIVLDRSAPNNPGLYPSDHYGLMARIRTG